MLPLKEWQGILFAYGVLLVLAETELGPLASLMAWGLAVTYFVDANVTQGNLIANLFTAPGGAAISPQQQANQATQGQIAAGSAGQSGSPGAVGGLTDLTTSSGLNVTGR